MSGDMMYTSRLQRRRVTQCLELAILLLITACGGGDGGTTPDETLTAAIFEGQGVSATAGDPVSVRPAVKVTGHTGTARAGVTVTFTVTGGGGSASGTSQVTDANGVARVNGWTLGAVAGANSMSASIVGVSETLVFTAQGVAGAPTSLTRVAGDAQSASVGTAVATRPAVRANDRGGNVVSGVAVTFTPAVGSGTLTTATVNTGSDGVATVGAWTLGTTMGAHTLSASTAGVATAVTFGATATTGAAALLAKQAGDAQTAVVGATVPVAPSLRVTDQFGNPVSGQAVTFAVATGGGSVTAATAVTNASGVAAVGSWTLGTTAGAQTLSGTVTGIAPLTFSATASPGSAALLSKQGGDAQTATVATVLPVSPTVKVTDQYGNALNNQTVAFAIASGAGALNGATSQTNPSGVATVGSWTLGTVAGAQSVTATVAGIASPLTFTATANPGPAALLAKTAGDAQTAAGGTLLPINPAVRVSDQFGNLLSGRVVAFTVTSGGGTLAGATPTTGSNGIAAIAGWTLGTAVGSQSVQASVDAISVLFTATATAVLNIAPYVGTYTGTWINTTFGSTGTGTATIGNDAVTRTATLTASATGSVLGTPGGVAPTLRNAVYGTSTGSFTGVVAPMGTITGTIDANGNIVASGTNVPNPAISRWDATGTINATQIRFNFTVTFTAGPPAVGSISLNKP